MAITNVVYDNEANSSIRITFDGGSEAQAPWPVGGDVGSQVQEWIDLGNTIGAYVKPLALAQDEKITAILSNYRTAEVTPINLGGNDYHADRDAKIDAMAVELLGAQGFPWPAGFTWPTTTGVLINATQPQFHTLFEEIVKKQYLDERNKQKLINEVKAATTVAEVEAIADW